MCFKGYYHETKKEAHAKHDAHACDPSIQEAEAGALGFKAILGYTVSSKPAWSTQQDLV